jgi:hypothetical protein
METTATLNPIMTGYAAQFMREAAGFVCRKLAPPFMTAMQAAQYYLFTPENIANVPTLTPRGPGTDFARVTRDVSNDSYACLDYGVESPVPDEDRAKYAAYFNADIAAIHQIVDTILLNHEIRVHTLATNTAVVPYATPAIKWDNGASNPKGDIDQAKENIRLNMGLRANLLIMSEPVFLTLQYHPRLVDLFKYTTPGLLNEQKLASYFGVQEVAVAYNVIANNNQGQAFSPADIWGHDVVLAHVEDAQDLTRPNFARAFCWSAFTKPTATQTDGTGAPGAYDGSAGSDLINIFSYREEKVKSDIHRSEHYVTEKLVAPYGGFYLQNVISQSLV